MDIFKNGINVSSSEKKNLLLWGVGSLASGLLYKLVLLWGERATCTTKLDVPVDNLWSDKELYALFCQLQEHKGINEVAFITSVDHVDNLVFLNAQLLCGAIKPCIQDRIVGFYHYKRCLDEIENMVSSAKVYGSARTVVEINRLYELIFECTQKHRASIFKLTRDVKNRR